MKLQNAVYWGQSSSEKSLDDYCNSRSGIDIIILAFLFNLLPSSSTLSGTFGPCSVSDSGSNQGCESLSAAIKTCQAANVKIILSLGGWISSISLQSQSQAESVGQYLWDMYGNESNITAPRPFGEAFVNGFDFDIEHPEGNQYYQYIIATLRSNFAKDPSNKYYITGAPQCHLPEPNMGAIIEHSEFDYLWVQFYNNECALALNNGESFNYADWEKFLSTTPSKSASLFIGLPASTLASNGAVQGAQYYVAPQQVANAVEMRKNDQNFGGIMLWNAGYSDENNDNECTYAQNMHRILDTGSPCGTSESTQPSQVAAAAIYTPQKDTKSSPLMTVPMWGQCGGQGYTGPTLCLPPYQCIIHSKWWSSCH